MKVIMPTEVSLDLESSRTQIKLLTRAERVAESVPEAPPGLLGGKNTT